MTNKELIARLRASGRHPMMDNNCKVDVFLVNDAADRIEQLVATNEALTEQLAAARQDAKEAEAYAGELENEAVLSKAAYEGVSSLLLSVQQDCIKERQRAERLEAKLAKAMEESKKYERAFAAQSRKLQAVLHIEGVKATLAEIKGESHD